MTALFLKLADMSLSASWLILAVIAARLVLKKAPKSIRCVLWALVAVRLICPFSFESEWSLIPKSNPTLPAEVSAVVSDPEPGEVVYAYSAPAGKEQMQSESYLYFAVPTANGQSEIVGPVADAETVGTWLNVIGILWAAGMAAMILYALWSYSRIYKKVSASIDIGNGVYICDYIGSPFILGILRPKIYLPSALSPENAAYVLAHERSHLKRRDHWWKPLGFVLLAVYWFNPLIWVAYVLLCRDIELACDERVIRQMGTGDKKAYSEALLSCSVPRRMIAACPLAFGEVGVKERVKSVLNYKKPAFWIILIAVVLCIVVAVGFLTDPLTTTLAELGDLDTESALSIYMQTRKAYTTLESGEDLSAIFAVLESTKYAPTPLEGSKRTSALDENGWNYPALQVCYPDDVMTYYYFDEDYTVVWVTDEEGGGLPYSVKNPEAIRQLFSEYLEPVKDLTAAAAPFASIDEGWQWTRNVTLDAIETAYIAHYYGNSIASGYLRGGKAEELLSILNALPQESITKGNYQEKFSTANLDIGIPSKYSYIKLTDGANGIIAMIYYIDDTLDFVLCNRSDDSYGDAQYWSIQSEELEAFMQEYQAYHGRILTFTGASLTWNEEPTVVSHGNVSIYTHMLSDWDYEMAEYSEGADSFGIRCRPKAVDEGWIYFSFWPGGYAPVEENRYYTESYSSSYHTVTSWPQSMRGNGNPDAEGYAYSYTKTEYPTGDYAVINDGADAWFVEYTEAIRMIDAYTSFRYGEPLNDSGTLRTYGNVTVDFTGTVTSGNSEWPYVLFPIDWDTIAAELGAEELILFDPQEYDDLLFVGCQNGDEYAVAVFRRGGESGCEYVQLLKDSAIWQKNDDEQTTLLYANYPTAETYLRLYLLTNEAITGISYTLETAEGPLSTDYAIIDHCPAMMLLDIKDPSAITNYSIYYNEPLAFSHYGPWTYAIDEFRFAEPVEETNSLWKTDYILEAVAGFTEEESNLFYNLTPEESLAIRDILTTISAESIRPVTGESDENPITSLSLTCYDGILGSEERRDYCFYYYGENVGLTLTEAGDTAGAAQQYYFTITNESLNTFMGALYDPDRTESELHRSNGPYFDGYVRAEYADVTIRVPQFPGWVYEKVDLTSDTGSFGVRCRPETEDSGWLYLSFWPNGYRPEEENRFYSTNGTWSTGYNDHIASYPRPGSTVWSYIRYSRDIGEFAIINDGADSWFEEYDSTIITYLKLLTQFIGGKPTEITYPGSVQTQYTQSEDPSFGPWRIWFEKYSYLTIDEGWAVDPWDPLVEFWPEEKTEGSVTFEFIEGGFTAPADMTVEHISLSEPIRPIPAHTASKPGDDTWSCLWIDVDGGSYLFQNKAIGLWEDTYFDQVMAMINKIVIEAYDVP